MGWTSEITFELPKILLVHAKHANSSDSKPCARVSADRGSTAAEQNRNEPTEPTNNREMACGIAMLPPQWRVHTTCGGGTAGSLYTCACLRSIPTGRSMMYDTRFIRD